MIAAAIALTLCAPVVAIDGDTLKDCAGRRWRLAGIDAPDFHCRRGRRCAPGDPAASRDALAAAIADRAVRVELVDANRCVPGFQAADPFGRPVVLAWAAGIAGELGAAQRAGGWAIAWRCRLPRAPTRAR